MANSLRSKLSKLRHDGHITDAEYQAFIKKLDGHDAEIRNKAIDEFWESIMYYCSMPAINRKMITQIARKLKEGAE